MNLEQKFNKNNMKIENRGNKIYITSNYGCKDKITDNWFIFKSDKKLILFHKSEHNHSKKTIIYHRQYVAYNYDDIIERIVNHDSYKSSKNRINNLFGMIENNNMPKFKLS